MLMMHIFAPLVKTYAMTASMCVQYVLYGGIDADLCFCRWVPKFDHPTNAIFPFFLIGNFLVQILYQLNIFIYLCFHEKMITGL